MELFLELSQRKIKLLKEIHFLDDKIDQHLQITEEIAKIDKQMNDFIKKDRMVSTILKMQSSRSCSKSKILEYLIQTRKQIASSPSKLKSSLKTDTGNIWYQPEIKKPLSDLTRIKLFQMDLLQEYPENYVIVEIIGPAYKIVGSTFLIEDESGYMMCGIYNDNFHNSLKTLDTHYKVGRLLCVKHPFIKTASTGENILFRSDNFTNVSFVDDLSSDLLKETKWYKPNKNQISADEFKDQGNIAFKAGYHLEAIRCYERGIKLDPNNLLLLSNCSQANLEIGEWEMALEYANKALSISSNHEKSMIRKAKALYELEEYRESLKLYSKCNQKDQVAKCLKSIRESEKCQYDYDWDRVDTEIATYFSKSIKIELIEGKGRGIIATEDISKGTIVIVETPLAKVTEPEQNNALSIDYCSESYSMTALMEKLRLNMSKNSKIRKRAMELSNGFSNFNVKLSDITDVNCFGGRVIYYFVSFFNHSCIPNCLNTNENDNVFVKTTSDIKKGEELTISYFPLNLPYLERKAFCDLRKFECDCVLCVSERKIRK